MIWNYNVLIAIILFLLGELTGKNETTYEFFKSKDYPYDYITAVRSQKTAKVSIFFKKKVSLIPVTRKFTKYFIGHKSREFFTIYILF